MLLFPIMRTTLGNKIITALYLVQHPPIHINKYELNMLRAQTHIT